MGGYKKEEIKGKWEQGTKTCKETSKQIPTKKGETNQNIKLWKRQTNERVFTISIFIFPFLMRYFC